MHPVMFRKKERQTFGFNLRIAHHLYKYRLKDVIRENAYQQCHNV